MAASVAYGIVRSPVKPNRTTRAEKRNRAVIDRSLFGLPGIRRILLLLAGLAVLAGSATFGLAWSLSSALTHLWQGAALSDQCVWIGLFLLCFVGVQGIAWLQDLLLDNYAHERADELRHKLVTAVFTRGPELVQASGTGTTTTLLLEGVAQVEAYLRLILPKICRLLIIPLLLVVPIFLLDWVSGVVVVIVFPFIVFYMVLLGRVAGEKAARQHRKYQVLSNHFIDSLRGIDTLKLFGASRRHGKNIYAVSEQFRRATLKTLRIATLSGGVLDLFVTLSVAAVAILLGLRLLDGSLTLFPALTILILAPEYFKPLREFAADFHASLDGRNALASIQTMLRGARPDAADVSPPSLPLWNNRARLAASGLGFTYDAEHEAFEALSAVSFEVSGFTKVGIIGASGAGKSSLIQLLAGFSVPDAGTIHVNDTPAPSLKRADWHSQIAFLPQNPSLFHATLRENLAFYHPQASDEEIAEAVAVVGLQDLIAELPEGLDTQIGEGARALSGGQAQRVALARVCLDTRIRVLLFDEPTAHLDIETELELKARMLSLMQDRLVFFATHRLHWMQSMDLIWVLDGGKIVESGTLEELRARGGYCSSLIRQLEGVEA